MRLLPLLVLAFSIGVGYAQIPSDRFTPGPDAHARLFAFTNGRHTFFAGPIAAENTNGFHGLTRAKRKLFENWWILLGDSLLDRGTATVTVTPVGITREYPRWSTTEEILLTDSLTVLAVRIRTNFRGPMAILPGFPEGRGTEEATMGGAGFRLTTEPRATLLVRGMQGFWSPPDPRVVEGLINASPVSCPAWFDGMVNAEPVELTIHFPENGEREDLPRFDTLQSLRRARIAARLDALGFDCSDSMLAKSTRWIAASVDALVMKQTGPGLYAGLPWFDDYWGRDTFISLPGALLVQGRFEDAQDVLEAFAARQEKDPEKAEFGRIPNRITPTEVIYNTADGTPWFVIQAWNTYERSGDLAFARRIWPAVHRSVEGGLRHRDGNGLLIHGDAETWMDAVGPKGPWSPRGTRAIDVQALWIAQLEAAASFAGTLGETRLASEWHRAAETARASVRRLFPDPRTGILADRLDADEQRDPRPRPNSLFALTVPRTPIVADSIARATLASVMRTCVYPWGVASLGQDDPDFHPWHENPGVYPKDAAYHMGTIWTWLSGPTISALCRAGQPDSAWVLLEYLAHLSRTQGAVGALPECTDALPRDGQEAPRWSGTFSQTWSAAEYLRVLHDTFLGVRVTALSGDTMWVSPALPRVLTRLGMRVRIGPRFCMVTVERRGREAVVRLRPEFSSRPLVVVVPGQAAKVLRDTTETVLLLAPAPSSAFHASFCRPISGRSWSSIALPPWPLLSAEDVLRLPPPTAPRIVGADPEGDDHGRSNTMTYPRNPLFRPGILDVRRIEVRTDDSFWYFTIRMQALVQPGWHPEYGFQLTYLAILVNTTGTLDKAGSDLGHQSGYRLPEDFGYDRLILVGGGLEIRDAGGRILAAWTPTRPEHAFGDVRTATIRFAIPTSYFPSSTTPARVLILSGAQDDQGGARLGSFRDVLLDATEWQGGGGDGKERVYDVMWGREE